MTATRQTLSDWLRAGIVVWICLLGLMAWGGYVLSGAHPRPVQLPPGAGADFGTDRVRLVSLVAANELEHEGGDPYRPTPGAVFLVAELEVRRGAGDEPCVVQLIATDGRRWRPTTDYRTTKPSVDCSDAPAGSTVGYQAIFVVPAGVTGQIAGVADALPRGGFLLQLLTPPRS